MDLKTLLQKYQPPKQSDKPQRNVQPWQDYAAKICKEFGIIDQKYKVRIFQMAKKNKCWLEGKVESVREIQSFNPVKFQQLKAANKLGNYLFATFRKKEE